jgi:hypothetical protein
MAIKMSHGAKSPNGAVASGHQSEEGAGCGGGREGEHDQRDGNQRRRPSGPRLADPRKRD